MTLTEVLNRFDNIHRNAIPRTEKVKWLDTLDFMIYRRVVKTHEGWEKVDFKGYDDSTPGDTTMIAPDEDLYMRWMEASSAYYYKDYNAYNNAILEFNEIWKGFRNDYNREHMPLQAPAVYF